MKTIKRMIALDMIKSGRISASEDGVIYCHLHGKTSTKKTPITNGYYRFNTSWNGTKHNFLAHQIVWLQFNPESIMDGQTINHKDGNKLNNAISNLELITYRENYLHASDIGLVDLHKNAGDNCGTSKLTWSQALMIKSLKDVCSQRHLAKKYGVFQGTISSILRDQTFKLKFCPDDLKHDEIYSFAKYKIEHCDMFNARSKKARTLPFCL